MRNLVMTSKNASVSRNAVTSRSAQIPEYSAPLIKIKAKVTQEKISYLMDSFICTEIKPQKNGFINVTFNAPDSPWLCDILLSFGAQIKIVSPAKLKSKIAEMAGKISDLYK
jgi:predicted DNA-binding transcriptional regulator YafY